MSMIGHGITVKHIPLGTAYAVWMGIGAALTVGWAMATGVETANPFKLLFIAGIVGCAAGFKALPRKSQMKWLNRPNPRANRQLPAHGILPRLTELPQSDTTTRRRRT